MPVISRFFKPLKGSEIGYSIIAFLVGFWSLAGQFVFNRIIFFYVANSEYAAASIISLHLFGFLVGSMIAKNFRAPIDMLVGSCLVLTPLAQFLVWSLGVEVFGLQLTTLLVLIFAFLLAVTSGLLLLSLIETRPANTSPSGIVIADSVGSVLGAIVGGFVLVPALGLAMSFQLIAGLQGLALAYVTIASFTWFRAVRAFALLAVSMVLLTIPQLEKFGRSDRILHADGLPVVANLDEKQMLDQERTAFGVLTVVQDRSSRRMFIDSRQLCSIDTSQPLEATSHWREGSFIGQLVSKGEGAPKNPRVAMVGLGCGTTLAGLLGQLPSEENTRVDVIDINPGVVMLQKYFKELLPHDIDDKRVDVKIQDGFSYFTSEPDNRGYDAVMIDVVWMQNMNATHLFSFEMYENVRKWLSPRGVLSVWTEQSNPFSPVSLIIYRSLKSVFSQVYVDVTRGSVIFFASKEFRREFKEGYFETAGMQNWIDDSARFMEINKLDNLVMNRYRFDYYGGLIDEDLPELYKKLGSRIGVEE